MAVKLTIRKSFFNVKLKVSDGEYLRFTITASGAKPTFTYQSKTDHVFSANEFPGHPKSEYKRKWPRVGDDPPQKALYALGFGFLGATKYTLVVELCDADNNVVKTIKDIDYARETQDDLFSELFNLMPS